MLAGADEARFLDPRLLPRIEGQAREQGEALAHTRGHDDGAALAGEAARHAEIGRDRLAQAGMAERMQRARDRPRRLAPFALEQLGPQSIGEGRAVGLAGREGDRRIVEGLFDRLGRESG